MSQQAKIDELNGKIELLSAEVAALKNEAANQAKMRALEWTIANVAKIGPRWKTLDYADKTLPQSLIDQPLKLKRLS